MDTESTQPESTFNKALETTTVEIRDFLFSDTYPKLITAIATQFAFSEEKKKILDDVVFETLIGNIDEEEAQEKLSSLGLTDEDGSKLVAYIDYYFITPSIEKASENDDEEQEGLSPTNPPIIQSAPSPIQALEMIKERLAKPSASISLPTKRDYSEESIEKIATPAPQGIKSIDPYRELPEK